MVLDLLSNVLWLLTEGITDPAEHLCDGSILSKFLKLGKYRSYDPKKTIHQKA